MTLSISATSGAAAQFIINTEQGGQMPAVARSQFGVFTIAQAKAVGISPDRLERDARRGRIVRVRRGVYGDPVALEVRARADEGRALAARAVAATLGVSAAVASHHGAAAIAGLPVLGNAGRPCVTVLPGFDSLTPDAHLHRATLLDQDRERIGALKLTSVGRTICDVGRESGITSGVVLADAAMQTKLVTLQALETTSQRFGHWPGGHRLEKIMSLCDGRSESVLETLSRLAMVRGGLPLPQLQVEITDRDGHVFARPDFLWPEFGVRGEADGAMKYSGDSPAALYDEKIRQERLEALGYVIVRWGWPDLRTFEIVIRRLLVAFANADRRLRVTA